MLILLPPSETKRRGGASGSCLDLAALRFAPELTPSRRAVIAGVRRLSRNLSEAVVALGLGPKSAAEAALNRELGASPVIPALDRFDGVLFDALDAPSLDGPAREFASQHLLVHSALFGLLGALDPVPAYRLSADSRLPGMSLKRHWAAVNAAVLGAHDGLILDLRSEAYAALGPAPRREGSVFVRVVTRDGEGRRRALNHFNKHAKGAFTRRLLSAGTVHETVASVVDWAHSAGMELVHRSEYELELVVE